MQAQAGAALSDAEMASFLAFVGSAAYSDQLRGEEMHGAFVDGQLVGTASWLVTGDDGETARITSVFVHPMFARLGIGARLLGEVEARACQAGLLRALRLHGSLARREGVRPRVLASRRLPAQARAAARPRRPRGAGFGAPLSRKDPAGPSNQAAGDEPPSRPAQQSANCCREQTQQGACADLKLFDHFGGARLSVRGPVRPSAFIR
jgi:GNAT superfamily N-acetyltransferase